MGIEFLVTFFKSFFGKIILITIGMFVFTVYFSDIYVTVLAVAKFSIGYPLRYLLDYDTALFLADFLQIVFSAHFFVWLYEH